MSDTEIATTNDFILSALKQAQEKSNHNRSIAIKSPSRWILIARHVMEDGLDITEFINKNGIPRWTYYDIAKTLKTSDDYEKIRDNAALDAATDYEMGVDLERKYSEKMHEKMDSGELEIDAQGYAQINRGQTMKAERFQKFSGAATSKIVVEHKTTLDEAKAFRDAALAGITEAEIVD